jgi:hypothetical protein
MITAVAAARSSNGSKDLFMSRPSAAPPSPQPSVGSNPDNGLSQGTPCILTLRLISRSILLKFLAAGEPVTDTSLCKQVLGLC